MQTAQPADTGCCLIVKVPAGKGAVCWRKVHVTEFLTDTVLGREGSPPGECGHYEANMQGSFPPFDVDGEELQHLQSRPADGGRK